MANPAVPFVRFARFAVLALLLAIPSRAVAQAPGASDDALARVNESIDALTRKVWPSVVQILVTSYGPQQPDLKGETSVVVGKQRSVGSGFVVDAEGYIITNAHVVSGAQRVQVVLPAANADGTLASALSSRTRRIPLALSG